MNTKTHEWCSDKASKLKSKELLYPNPEYQRGLTWSPHQKQKLIDSMLRGYPLPKFYMHCIEEIDEELDLHNRRWEIVDGQQRLNAVEEFRRDRFPLLDPRDPKSKFPLFQRDMETPWSGKRWSDLNPEFKQAIMDFPLTIVEILDPDPNVVRDLFVRLQSGADLTSQERRDAYPGDFCQFVYSIGGKDGLVGHHPFFDRPGVKGIKPSSPRSREFAAQLTMTVLNMESRGGFSDMRSENLDELYYERIAFDPECDEAKLVLALFDGLHDCLKEYDGPKLAKHELLHASALWLDLAQGYVPDWKDRLVGSVANFNRALAEAVRSYKEGNPNETWIKYGASTWGSGTDRASSFNRRHPYYLNWMRKSLRPVSVDPNRGFQQLDKVLLWYEANGVCAYSGEEFCGDSESMPFNQSHLHHIIPHSSGGSTCLKNAALVHSSCNLHLGSKTVPVTKPSGELNAGETRDDCQCGDR